MSPADQPPRDPDPGDAEEAVEAELYRLVATRLKVAHAQVRALDVSEPIRAALTRSLLLVTEAAKRDLPEAARRLARFTDALDSGELPLPPGS
jgi:hypothetical protein